MSKSSSLAGDTAAAVVRALLDYGSVWTTHDVVSVAEVPAAAVHPVVRQLEETALLARPNSAVISVPDWFNLLCAWCQDYGFSTDNSLSRWRTRTSGDLLERVGGSSIQHAVTGTRAASSWVPDSEDDGPLIVYTPDARLAGEVWELIPAADGEIVLAEPNADVVFERMRKLPSGTRTAAPAQVLADLLTGAYPTLAAANRLVAWMEANEEVWRY